MSNPNSNPNLTTPAGPSTESHEDVIEFLSDDSGDTLELDDKPKPKAKEILDEGEGEGEGEGEEGTQKVEDDLLELEQELEGPKDEQLELITPVRRKEILKEFPDLFKKFPYLERAYYRDQKFTEKFPTMEDADAAVEAKHTLDRMEADVMGGNTELILRAVKEQNPEGFARIVDEYLPTLARVDEKAYFHLLGNINKHLIITMVREARRSGNEALQSAAQILNQFVFGTSDFQPPQPLSRPRTEDGREKQISEREQQFVQQQFESARDDLNTRVNNTLRNTIDLNIDPKKTMTDYVRKNASREAMEMLESVLSKDARFIAIRDKLWEAAFNSNFSRESVERIKSAYLSRAKTLLPTVIKKARIDALKGIGRRSGEEERVDKTPVTPGRPRSDSSGGKITKASEIPKGMRTIDFLNS